MKTKITFFLFLSKKSSFFQLPEFQMVNLRSSGKDELERGSCSVFKISIEKEYFNMIKPEDKLHKQMQEYAETPAYFVCFSEEYALLGVSKASISY
ncbi:hypothetical protein NXX54_22510 [Bacteroides sp. BFG-638]|uniref:Uncharacterized protein n=2 Tax=Bacteroides TaxID=816 RepID=A0ABU5HLX5_9BACE|nr:MULTISPECIES: hypothetical protein [unclassified Bacteroides]MCS2337480.1 hypothetical protein [Bacteroides sp. BFG-606]MCS2950959.1 hypothetical protein [Bacteroides sp. BFG-638]MCS3314559.1 hypothetical protein [Bacteroides sp. BFG-637]MDY7254441.1 hypothetical protein [Bacteroides sp. A1-P5]MDY7257188.1 hypothetical protein [Bacteroides sp. A2-P53]